MTLADELRRERAARRWSRQRAAAMCGLSLRGYEFIEDGARRDTALVTLKQIASGFGCAVVVLPGGDVRLEPVSLQREVG